MLGAPPNPKSVGSRKLQLEPPNEVCVVANDYDIAARPPY